MIVTLLVILLGLGWLGYETDWLRVRLPIGASVNYRQRWLDAFVPIRGGWLEHELASEHTESTTSRHTPLGYHIVHSVANRKARSNGSYEVILSLGVEDVLCGTDWLNHHANDLNEYTPKVEMTLAGVRYNMTIRDTSIIEKVMKANRLTRQEKRELREYVATAA